MEYIEKLFKKSRWVSIIESLIFALLGIILICKPEGTLKFITFLLGTIFILTGIYKIINYFVSKGRYNFYDYDLAYGLVACIIGIITIFFSSTIGSIFRIIIGLWIIYSSFIRMNLSTKLKALNTTIWICGLYITVNSGAIIVTIGIMMIIYSVIDIIEDIIFMKNIKEIF